MTSVACTESLIEARGSLFKMAGDNTCKHIERFFSSHDFCYLNSVATLVSEFISLSQKDFIKQNTERCGEFCKSFAKAFEQGLSNLPPRKFPDPNRMGSYEFDYKFEMEQSERFHSDYPDFLKETFDAKLRDAQNSERFTREVLPNFKNVGVIKKSFLSELGYETRGMDRDSIDLELLSDNTLISWEIKLDRSNARSPKHLSFFFGGRFGEEKSKYLNIDLSLIDFRLAFLKTHPTARYSKYSKEQCVLKEHYSAYVQLSIFPMVVAEIEKILPDSDSI